MDNKKLLQECGIYKDGDAIIYGYCLPKVWEIAVYGKLSPLVGMTNFAITRNEDYINIIPLDKVTAKIIVEQKITIPCNEITHIDIDKGSFGFYKISLMKQDSCLFFFEISERITPEVEENLDIFFNGFQCNNKEIIKTKTPIGIYVLIVLFLGLFLIGAILSFSMGDYFVAIFLTVLFIYFLYLFIKSNRKS